MVCSCAAVSVSDLPVLFLLGPTACGKTSCSIKLAQSLNAEIISVDSALVYKDMDIGTAKPDMQERHGVPHHLIDVCTPDQAYSVARFCTDALVAIDAVHARGKRALLTGGTMLYFNALEKGIAPLPDASPELRKTLNEEGERIGWPAMHKKLAVIDPAAAGRIHPNDPQRIQRALEVYELSGKPLTELQKQTVPFLTTAPLKFALLPEQRPWLHERIERRFKMMLDNGFVEELKRLQSKYELNADLPSMRSVGYRQAWEHLAGDVDLATMTEKATVATRQLAKRQITWIRSMDALHKIACDSLNLEEQVESVLSTVNEQVYNKP